MKKIKCIVFILFMFLVGYKEVNAGSLSVSANANTLKVGQTVTISVYGNNIFGTFNIILSDSSILSGPSSGDVDNDTSTYTFTAKKAGTVTITIKPTNMADYDTETKYTSSKYVTLKVIEPASTGGGNSSGSNPSNGSSSGNSSNGNTNNNSTGGTTADKKTYSSDNTLSSLSVEKFDISPKFDKNTLEYKLEVDENVEKVYVRAKASDDKAEINGIGEINLSSGENEIVVKVTAENGNEKNYKIIVTVKDLNPIDVIIDKKKYTIVKKNNDLIEKLEKFEESNVKIDNQDVVCYINNNSNLNLVILKDEDSKYSYYVYDEKNNTYELYREINNGNITLFYKDMPSKLIPSGYKKYSFEYNDQKFIGYKYKKNNDFYLIYAMNVDSGELSLYKFDNIEKTFQRYDTAESEFLMASLSNVLDKYKLLFYLSTLVIVMVLIVYIIAKKVKLRKKNKNV